jgi:hypothetical protein
MCYSICRIESQSARYCDLHHAKFFRAALSIGRFATPLASDAHTLLLCHRIIRRSRIPSEPLELNSGNQHHDGCDNLKS